MKLIDIITKRYSVRSYRNKPVEDEKLIKILDSGRLAPSAVNFQPWFFIVIRGKSEREKFNKVYHREWFRTAPVVIVICADHSTSWKRSQDNKDFTDVDASIAIDHMTLQATDLGLGTCWVCNFDVEECIKLLELPAHIEPIALLPLGYPDDKPPVKKRKTLDEIVYWGKFGISKKF
ncbi:MAG: nitroreductase family protein [Mariniphaga sp.]|nr:nitroreductase family protein [Mariniphaga sp.]